MPSPAEMKTGMAAVGLCDSTDSSRSVLLLANTDWYLYNFQLAFGQFLRDRGWRVLFSAPDGKYRKKVEAFGFQWLMPPLERSQLTPTADLHTVRWLRKVVEEEGIALLHCFTLRCALLGAITARTKPRLHVVASITGLGYVFASSTVRAKITRIVVKRLLAMIVRTRRVATVVQNKDDRNLVASLGSVDPESLFLIRGSGVDCTKFCPTNFPRPSNSGSTVCKVLLPARMLWDKGIGEFVDAARQLFAEGCSVSMIMAGDLDKDNPSAVSRESVESWVRAGYVSWLGHVDDMASLYNHVDIIALPSYREGLPKSLIEAAACGKPLIATDVPGCREVVVEGVNGVLVPPRDPRALADAIRSLVENVSERQRLGVGSRERCVAEFDCRLTFLQMESLYSRLLHGEKETQHERISRPHEPPFRQTN